MFASRYYTIAVMATGFLALAPHADCADLSLPVTGNILGSVVDPGNTPEMGATVLLFNRYESLVAKTLSASDGRFVFAGLAADSYSIRVSVPSFLPAFRDHITVKAGLDSMLQIHLATLFSSVQLSYTLPTSAMTNDWKWVLRSSPSTRLITRFLPREGASEQGPLHSRIFSQTHAMLSVSGGEGGLIDSDSTQGDMGTEFALSTNLLGKNLLQVAGTYGQTADFGPAAMGLCAIYSRAPSGGFGDSPEITLAMSQVGVLGPQTASTQMGGTNQLWGAAQTLRTISANIYEASDLSDNIRIEYGMTAESVDYVQHLSRVSPFARLTVGAGSAGDVIAAYSDGGRPDQLTAHQESHATEADVPGDDLAGAVNTLSRLPQVSSRNGKLELQRTQALELGYRKIAGSRTYAVSAFYENVQNGRLNLAGDLNSLDSNNFLSDGISKTVTYNIGAYSRNGYIASVTQRMSDSLDVAFAYGRMGGFIATQDGLAESLGVQERFLQAGNHNIAAVNARARVPISGTRITASYGWMEDNAIVPRHIFTTQNAYVAPGLNVFVRQPLPSLFGMPGHLELTADLRNLMAQGYVPLMTGDGQRLLVVPSPRAIRGGLNFRF